MRRSRFPGHQRNSRNHRRERRETGSLQGGDHDTHPRREQLARAYGIEAFTQVEEIRYTFNAKIGERVISRRWSWMPQIDQVVFLGTEEQGGTVAYDRAGLSPRSSELIRKVDPWFINDNYWLIFPLRLYWDRSATVTAEEAPALLPIGTGRAKRLVVRYPSNEGYTPGDIYELFVDKSDRIVQWIYRKGGEPTPTRIATWEDYRRAGPLTLALDHRGADEGFRVWFTDVAVRFRVWFTDVAVRLAGRPEWIPAE